ncbi:hypothetical protein BGZ57DRAFT_852704 [Hyaloscypha finlandica]|nr:hypothetical protein BGZ57DRAFT_852704 [Hyaloscypha finlandica]
MTAGGWRLEAGGWRLEAGGWRLEPVSELLGRGRSEVNRLFAWSFALLALGHTALNQVGGSTKARKSAFVNLVNTGAVGRLLRIPKTITSTARAAQHDAGLQRGSVALDFWASSLLRVVAGQICRAPSPHLKPQVYRFHALGPARAHFDQGGPGCIARRKVIISSQRRQSKPASSAGCTAEVQAEPFAPRSSATNRLALVLGHNQKLTAPPSRSPPACEASVPGDSWKNIKERYQQRSPLTLKAVVGVSRDQSWPMNPRCLALDPEDPEDHPRLARSCLTQGAHVTDDRRRALTPQASFCHFKTLQGQLK